MTHSRDRTALLAVVPARKGSKGVPGKNTRVVAGQPLFVHTVRALEEAGTATRVVVSTDDPSILRWCVRNEVEAHDRRSRAADDVATIADVAALVQLDTGWEGVVGVFQPTSPLRSADSIERAWKQYLAQGWQSLMSVAREEHLFWLDGEVPKPLFAERVNRQQARHDVLRETGAIQFVDGDYLREHGTMVSERHGLFELPRHEVLDIDTELDMEFARRELERELVVYRITANERVGSGHLFHCLQIADALPETRAHFLLRDCGPFVHEILRERRIAYSAERDLATDLERLSESGRGLIINDVLDTQASDILLQKAQGFQVVTVEDLGEGARYADWVVNALYSPHGRPAQAVTGPRWAPLRPEFLDLPDRATRDVPRRVLLTFGGTDPSGLAPRVADAVAGLVDELVVVEGAGTGTADYPLGTVVTREADMVEEMLAADLVITSAGRTVYEACATGTPILVLAQNAREATHAHLGFETGVVFLGLGHLVDDEHIRSVAQRILENPSLRAELSTRLRRAIDGKAGERIAHHLRGMMKGL